MKKQTSLPASGRKLSLNKKTITNLTSNEMKEKVGGGPTKGHTCFTRCTSCRRTGCGICW